MRTIIGILMALLGMLGAVAGLWITWTSFVELTGSYNAMTGNFAALSVLAGLNLALVGLIAVHLALGPKVKKDKAS